MFDIGGWEFLIVMIIALVVIGPKDLPATIRNVSGWVRKARGLAREFQDGLSDIARDTELDSVQGEIREGLGLGEGEDIGNRIRREVEGAVDPDGDLRETLEAENYLDNPLEDLDLDDEEPDDAARNRAIADEAGEDDPEETPSDDPSTPTSTSTPTEGGRA
jgi:sec-independent protein translocase protein TatB